MLGELKPKGPKGSEISRSKIKSRCHGLMKMKIVLPHPLPDTESPSQTSQMICAAVGSHEDRTCDPTLVESSPLYVKGHVVGLCWAN